MSRLKEVFVVTSQTEGSAEEHENRAHKHDHKTHGSRNRVGTGTDDARPILCNHLLAATRVAAPVFSTRLACDLPGSGMIPAEDTEN